MYLFLSYQFDNGFGYKGFYGVIDFMVVENNFGVVVDFLSFVGQVVRVNIDVVVFYQVWLEG